MGVAPFRHGDVCDENGTHPRYDFYKIFAYQARPSTIITRDARIALVGRASSQWSFTSPYDYIAPTVTLFSISIQVVN